MSRLRAAGEEDMLDMGSAWHWARQLHEQVLYPGAVAVDATMGGGGDTEALCELVGESGRVYAFDIQPDAVERTRARLEEKGLLSRARLMCASHARMGELVPERVDAVLFNLGWLPGGDKSVTTLLDSTLKAVNAALKLLRRGGLMTICAYPGHDEGARELEALLEWASALDGRVFQVMVRRYLNQPANTPVMIAVERMREIG